MFINEDLDYLYRRLDYAIWQKESSNNPNTSKHQEALKMISYCNRKIDNLHKKRKVIKQLTFF